MKISTDEQPHLQRADHHQVSHGLDVKAVAESSMLKSRNLLLLPYFLGWEQVTSLVNVLELSTFTRRELSVFRLAGPAGSVLANPFY